MQKFFFLVIGIAFFVWVGYVFLNSPATMPPFEIANNGNSPATTPAILGNTAINIEIADTDTKKALGLSGRESLEWGRGMLFPFANTGKYGIWMKDMKFPIDIVWIDENFSVIGIERDVSPHTFPEVFYPPTEVKYVLEVSAGFASSNDIKVGNQLLLQE